jgi:hypothetical protein
VVQTRRRSDGFGLRTVSVETKQNILNFETLENYHLDEQRRLYVHAGFTNVNGVILNISWTFIGTEPGKRHWH